MKIKDLVTEAKANAPLALGKMPDPRAAKLVMEVLALIRAEVAVTEEGRVGVPGLGAFRIRQVEVTRGGETQTVKRVVFIPAAARPKKAKPKR
jgi:hypothetical protein